MRYRAWRAGPVVGGDTVGQVPAHGSPVAQPRGVARKGACGSGRVLRGIAALAILVVATGSFAQTRRYGDVSYQAPQDCSLITEQQPRNPFAFLFRDQCERINAQTRQSTARILGRPQPSRSVLQVPAHGTDEAKRLGVACMGGLVMLRLDNGWAQALDREHRYYTCRER